MRLRPVSLTVAAVAALGVLGMVGWDFLQLGRSIPPLARAPERATSIVVEKSMRRLSLMRGAMPIRTFDVVLGSSPVGHKQQEGDGRTPEGVYVIDFKNPKSRFHLALRISYPNMEDRKRAERNGMSPGSDIMVHGLPNGLGWLGVWHLRRDWTDGCIAVTDAQIEEIWALVDVGTRIDIRP